MAIVVRYFSTTSAGTGDGTSWANRAAFFTGGVYSTIITGFDFAGSDSLEVRLGPGTYSLSLDLIAARFTSGLPRPANPLLIHGCDSNGNRIIPTEWNCCQGALPVTNYPVLTFSAGFRYELANTVLRCLNITGANIQHLVTLGIGSVVDFCRILNSPNSTGSSVLTASTTNSVLVTNSHILNLDSRYNCIVRVPGSLPISNCRIEGASTANIGSRVGIYNNTIDEQLAQGIGPVCVVNTILGIYHHRSVLDSGTKVSNCTIIGRTTTQGIVCTTTAGGTETSYGKNYVTNSFISGCLTGISSPNAAAIVLNNRLRNQTNISSNTNLISIDNYEAAGTDADEFVDAANGDYRIKNTSIYWGKGLGAGDEPASGGGYYNPFRQPTRIG